MSKSQDEMADAIVAWIGRLEELRPGDGKFTQEILDKAGPFPIIVSPVLTDGKSAEEIVRSKNLEAVGAKSFAKAMAGSRLERKALYAKSDYYKFEESDEAKATDFLATANYLGSIRNYVAGL